MELVEDGEYQEMVGMQQTEKEDPHPSSLRDSSEQSVSNHGSNSDLPPVDQIFIFYREEREKIVNMIIKSYQELIKRLWIDPDLLSFDEYCMCQMGNPVDSHIVKNRMKKNTCPQCTNIGRLVDFRRTQYLSPFTIRYGSLNGKKIAPYSQIENLTLLIDDCTKSYRSIIEKILRKEIERYKILTSDSFTNSILISFFLQQFLTVNIPESVVISYTAFVCSDRGYILKEHLHNHLIDHINFEWTEPIFVGFMKQLVAIFTELKKIDFIFGSSNDLISHLVMTDQPVVPYKYSFNGKNHIIEGPNQLKIRSFDHSSLSTRSKTSNNQQVNVTLRITPYHKIYLGIYDSNHKLSSLGVEHFQYQSKIWFLLSGQFYDDIVKLRKIGIPLLGQSLDFYNLMFELMSNRSFNILMNHKYQSIWSSLFKPHDYDTIMEILRIHKGSTLAYLKGYKLCTDPVSEFISIFDN